MGGKHGFKESKDGTLCTGYVIMAGWAIVNCPIPRSEDYTVLQGGTKLINVCLLSLSKLHYVHEIPPPSEFPYWDLSFGTSSGPK